MARKKKSGKDKIGSAQGTSRPEANGISATSASMDNLSLNTPAAESSSSSPFLPETATPGSSREGAEVPDGSSAEPEEAAVHSLLQSEQLKLEGNDAFKAKSYARAIDLYSEAIALKTINEGIYLLNRAAAYMAIKQFKAALTDCQKAATLQSAHPQPKTLIRLARCQLSIGAPTPALSVLREVLALEPGNVAAKELQRKVLALEAHMRNFESARNRRDWAMARLALDQCMQTIDGEAGDVPSEWRCWRIELEVARRNWDQAHIAANEALRQDQNSADVLALRALVLFLTGKLPGALQHTVQALRLDPDNERAKKLRQRVKMVESLKEEGNTLFKTNQWREAITKYSGALDVIGNSEEEGKGGQIRATLLSNRATTLLKLEEYDAALADINESLDLHTLSYKALRTRARIHEKQEKFEEAVNDYKCAIETADHEGATADERALRTELRKAEAALKRSKTKDYYKILSVARDCNVREIKKAYHRESLKHHPDKGGDIKQFQLVGEAHAVLSDAQRRERYDMGVDEDGSMSSSPGGMGGFAPDDIMEMFAQGNSFGSRSGFGGFTFTSSGGHGTQQYSY